MTSVRAKIASLCLLGLLLVTGLRPSVSPQTKAVSLLLDDFTIAYDFELAVEGKRPLPTITVRRR